MTARIDGAAFVADERGHDPAASYDSVSGNLSITGTIQPVSGHFEQLTLYMPHFRGPGRYVLCGDFADSAGAFYTRIDFTAQASEHYSSTSPCSDGIVEVEAFSPAGRSVRGTFRFTGRRQPYSSEVVHIADGRYHAALYLAPSP